LIAPNAVDLSKVPNFNIYTTTTNFLRQRCIDYNTNFTATLNRMGSMLLFDRAEPNGYPENGASWISAGTLADALEMASETVGRSPRITAMKVPPLLIADVR